MDIHHILDNTQNNHINMSLDNIKLILNGLDNPQNKLKIIHVTGTNGKGSIVNYIYNALRYQGYNVGKFTSPHIYKINENITYNDHYITNDQLIFYYQKISVLMKKLNIQLSQFELLTVIMFLFFAENPINYAVIEVGMGGELDATNVIPSPIISVISNIGIEHKKFLGNTYLDIIKHKCGIIKNSLVVVADTNKKLIKYLTDNNYQYINVLNKYKIKVSLDFNNFKTYIKLFDTNNNPLLSTYLTNFGKYQALNFTTAYEVLTYLKINTTNIIKSANNTNWYGRLSIIQKDPTIILDVTHNAHGVKSLVNTFKQQYLKDDIIIITSILKDKNIPQMIYWFSQISDHIIITSITNNTRGLTGNQIIQQLAKLPQSNIYIEKEPQLALKLAKKLNKKIIIISGSTYLLKELIF
jgi:dihydrofolate synthase/folylpolyglutamate synthase